MYQTATEFHAEKHRWIHGPLSSINPDKVEGDISNYWRSLYKLEKGFQDSPHALKIASQVKDEVDAFKQHIPLVQVTQRAGQIFVITINNRDFIDLLLQPDLRMFTLLYNVM